MDAVTKAMTNCWIQFGETFDFECKTIKSYTLFKSFINNQYFNYAYISSNMFTENIKALISYFDSLPFSIIIKTSNDQLYTTLTKLNFVKSCECPGMILELTNLRSHNCHNFKVTHNKTNKLITDWIDVVSEGFDIDKDTIKQFAIPLSKLNNQMFYIVYDDQTPISAGLSSLDKKTAFISFVTTKTNYRYQGAGKALMEAILIDAKIKNRSYAALQSSADGEKLYKNLGFQEIVNYSLLQRC